MLALKLADRSWIVYTAPVRYWGVSLGGLWLIRIVCFALSIAVVDDHRCPPVREAHRATRHRGAAVRDRPPRPAHRGNGPPGAAAGCQDVQCMQAQIQTFIAHRTTMLAAISHDLRTPLTRIRLRGELIEDPEQQQRLFRDVDEMQAMVDGALAFFRDDAVAEETTLFDLTELISTVVHDYADQGIPIVYEGPTRAIYRGRPFALKRVLTNLADNAIKYGTPPDIELAQVDSA